MDGSDNLSPYNAEIFVYKPWKQKGFFQFEIIINVLFSSFCFIWIPMLWMYGHCQFFNSFSGEIVFRRQILTFTDVRIWRLKTVPALLTLSSLSLPLSSSSTTSRELLSQFSTCSGWRWLDGGEKVKKIAMYWWKPLVVAKLSMFSGM